MSLEPKPPEVEPLDTTREEWVLLAAVILSYVLLLLALTSPSSE